LPIRLAQLVLRPVHNRRESLRRLAHVAGVINRTAREI
jgi:hypothetical protein